MKRAQMRCFLGFCLVVLCVAPTAYPVCNGRPKTTNPDLQSKRQQQQLTQEDDAFLDDLEHRAFQYFWEQADPGTGIVRDRARLDGSGMDADHRDVGSIAATGFGLTALCIGAERHWMNTESIQKRVRATLRFFAEDAFNEHGWFYHWMNVRTGKRAWKSEVSSIDTALLLAGILTAQGYFTDDPKIQKISSNILNRVDFKWMLAGDPLLLSHGWTPEDKFLKSKWDTYSEGTLIYLLAIGAPNHSISPDSWYAWTRDAISYHDFNYIGHASLFTHQYTHAWFDLRGLKDSRNSNVDYLQNSITATLANRQFCIDDSTNFSGYNEHVWGITACDSAQGYQGWAAPPGDSQIDGTVGTSAAGGSLMFAPDLCLDALRSMKSGFGNKIFGRYGFADAFNPSTGWVDTDVIGIDLGITMLSAENLRTGNVWKWFGRNSMATRALNLAEFKAE